MDRLSKYLKIKYVITHKEKDHKKTYIWIDFEPCKLKDFTSRGLDSNSKIVQTMI